MDYRELADEPYDAIASVGMVEHVGEAKIELYAHQLFQMLRPGGRLLNHGIARRRHPGPIPGPFSERYVFPDAVPLHLSVVTHALESTDFSVLHVEGFPEQYVRTLNAWIANLDADLPNAIRIAGEERVRVWRLYLRAARNGFETGFCSLYQVLAERPAGAQGYADPQTYRPAHHLSTAGAAAQAAGERRRRREPGARPGPHRAGRSTARRRSRRTRRSRSPT